jgi:hypothetical protein
MLFGVAQKGPLKKASRKFAAGEPATDDRRRLWLANCHPAQSRKIGSKLVAPTESNPDLSLKRVTANSKMLDVLAFLRIPKPRTCYKLSPGASRPAKLDESRQRKKCPFAALSPLFSSQP